MKNERKCYLEKKLWMKKEYIIYKNKKKINNL